MATIQQTIQAITKLSSGGFSLDYDSVVKEAIEISASVHGVEITKEQVEEIKKHDYDENPQVKAYYQKKIAEFKNKTDGVIKAVQNIPTQFAGINATAANPKTAEAAVPMYVDIKNSVTNISSQLGDALGICSDLGIGAPDSVVSLVDKVATLKSLVGM